MNKVIKLLLFCSAFVGSGIMPQTKSAPPKETSASEKKVQPLVMQVVDLKRAGRYYIGRIVDKDGNYLVGALVKAVGAKGSPPYSSVSRTNGQFHVMAPFGDRYTLIVTMTQYQTIHQDIDPESKP